MYGTLYEQDLQADLIDLELLPVSLDSMWKSNGKAKSSMTAVCISI